MVDDKSPQDTISVDAPPSEQELWKAQRDIATKALDFAIAFLGCQRVSGTDNPIGSSGRARLLDICRAVSIVESRHGTQGAHQPARDPFQCGNPGDSWWKELTGQSGHGSRFVRRPDMTSVWADELAAVAETFPGFDPKAAMSTLADKKKGHQNSQFTSVHSYYWGIVYLIHRTNSAADNYSYICGELSRERLINGAVAYNGGGVPDYRERIEKALKEFGGLPTPASSEEFARSVNEGDKTMPDEPTEPGLSQVGALVLTAAGIVAALLLGWPNITAATYANVTVEAPKVVTALTVVAIFMERALAVINAAWLADETQKVKAMRRNAIAELELARSGLPQLSEDEIGALRQNLRRANLAVGKNDAKKQRIRVVVGFLFGLAISGAGVRTLSSLVTGVHDTTPVSLFNLSDIILTAGLLAGGSDGMAKVGELIGAAIDRTKDMLNKPQPGPHP